MDYRLVLLYQTYFGLKLDAADLTRLIARDECAHPADATDAIHGERARDYLTNNPDWWRRSADTLAYSIERGVRWSYLGRSDYPFGWYDLSCRPILFSYRGDPAWCDHPALSVVGSRTPSLDTRRWLEREFSDFLSTTRVVVVSGGARGVDQWAHRLALAAKRPTVCIVPSGILNPYPPGAEDLWDEIATRGGCLLSTFPPRDLMRKQNFPIRNRWIAGMSRVTFVAEANYRSGSYLTATLAAKEDRAVCTLPVSSNAAQGLANLQLIMDGHQMVRDATDLRVFCELNIISRYSPGSAQRIQGEAGENDIHQPQGRARGQVAIAGHALGGYVQNPVRDE